MTPSPNPWQAYNLRGSPYFQDSLSQNTANTPLSLFVGRERESDELLIRIQGSLTGSRQAVAGRPGIGKTTLVEAVKARPRTIGYWVGPKSITLTPEAAAWTCWAKCSPVSTGRCWPPPIPRPRFRKSLLCRQRSNW